MNNLNILQKISQNKRGPVLPNDLAYLMRAFENESINISELANIVADFPSIAARLMILANSAWAAPRCPVENLKTACLILGLDLVRNLCISISIESSFQSVTQCSAFKPAYFWCSSLLTAEAAILLASKVSNPDDFNSATLQTAGLLHNLGLLWLAGNFPEATAQALCRSAEEESLSTLQALVGEMGSDYCEVGGLLGRAWNFPDSLISAVEQHAPALYPWAANPHTVLVGYAAELVSAIQHGRLERPVCPPQVSAMLAADSLDNIYAMLQDKSGKIEELVSLIFLG